MENAQVKDIMTDVVITVRPEMQLIETANIIHDHKLNGVPVVDENKKLVGLVTEYNLINQLSVLQAAELNKNAVELHRTIERITKMKTADVMETKPLTLYFDDTYEAAVKLFNDHHRVNPVPVIDKKNLLVGVVSRYDLIKLLKLYGHS